MDDLVSVIIPVHNRAAMLRDAVASALAQTYRPIEIIIVDDGSTDDTGPVADSLASQHSEIRVIRHSNRGPGLSREAGRIASRGVFLQYLDSDDLLLPRKLELQVEALRAHPECGVAYGRTRYRNAEGKEIDCTWKNANQVQEALFPSFLVARWWETAAPLYRRSVTDAAGPWTEARLEEDWEYDARVGSLRTRLAFVDEVVCEHRDHGDHRLSRGAGIDAQRLRWRARSHELIYAHALRAGVPLDAPEMQHFARELFLLSRMCGAAGLSAESRRLFELARDAAGRDRDRAQFRIYRALAGMIGWTRAGKLSQTVDRLR